ncbi:unnamed protein product [Lactuca saligna]|uniref:Uncharacterized protein n=1 Tax=Lactuca saligna TaxID=75948 RepID=A0AA35Y6Q6_LACSI|nr:unnamed protein product [Lactuca saligna]
MVFGDDDDNDEALGGFTYSPFQIRTESKHEPSATNEQLKSLHEKIHQLLLASKASSSDAYSKAAIDSLFERITKEHGANAEKTNMVVDDSAEVCKLMTEKVNKLITETISFMENFQTTFNNNTKNAN